MKPRVRITALSSDEGPHFPLLEAAGFEVLPGNRTRNLWNEDELIAELEGCVAIVAGSEPYTPRVLEACKELRVIARTGVGFDAINLPACDRLGIVVATTPGVNHHSVAEHTIALLFGIARGFPQQDQAVRAGKWVRVAAPRVMGSTIGIVGLGRIGQATATRAVGLGLKVVAFEPRANAEFVKQYGIELASLDELLEKSDYVSLHCPVTPETKHLMNADRFAKMKPNSVLINTARGALVDEKALYDALKSGHLRGAGLDVFEKEPLPLTSPLLTLPNVLLAGHTAGLDQESQEDTLKMSADTIISLCGGKWPADRIQNLVGAGPNWKWAR
ncbi:3-phosphoglycerate dehydrogenase [Planctomyces sp. SCGC AG-212-M04]|nr:3-phosphoglycerate dehydrogenase [Planctomyces sp. SCGC AG-212-M04]